MARTPDAVGTATVSEKHQSESSFRLRAGPQEQSDVRALGGEAPDDHAPFELGGSNRLHDPLHPPPRGVNDALTQYGSALREDSEVLHALRLGDQPRAIVLLLQRAYQLQQELEAGREDFDELRAVSVGIQDRMDEALGVADDQRVQLIEELEITRDTVFALENQLEQERVDHESELERRRQERDALEAELHEVNSQFSEYQSRLWVKS